MEDSFALLYEQPLNKNVLRFNDAFGSIRRSMESTEIFFGFIFKRNVLEGLIGDSAQVSGRISRLTWKPLRTYLNIPYVNLQSDLKGAIRDSDIDELENLKRQIEKQAPYQEDHSEDLFDVNCCKNNINPLTNCQFPKINFLFNHLKFFPIIHKYL
jgi:hypothetical protein